MSQSKKGINKRDQRRLRIQQIIFFVIAGIVILSMIIGMVSN